MRDSMTEEGSITFLFLVFTVSIILFLGIVVDGGRQLSAVTNAQSVAEQAARIGANQFSITELRSGAIVLDPEQACEAANNFLEIRGLSGSCQVAGNNVIVQVSYRDPTMILGLIGINSFSVNVTASATFVSGVN
jgi:Flp pilus assembly protein TadG